MSLDERLAQIERTTKGDGCSFGLFVSSLPDGTRDLLLRVLSSRASNETVRSTLASEGHRFSRDTIRSHRAGECICNAKKADA